MDIRIGNNILCKISLSSLNIQTIEDIKYARGIFTAVDNDKRHPSCSPQFHDSEYTIHDRSTLQYNAMPANYFSAPFHGRGCSVYEDYSSPVRTNDDKDSIILKFPAKELQNSAYKLKLQILTIEEKAEVKEFDYGIVFNIVGEKCCDCCSEDIEIELDTKPEIDTFVSSSSVSYIQRIKGKFSIIAIRSKKYNLATLLDEDETYYNIPVHIRHTNDRVVIISKYNNLQFKYDNMDFPVAKIDTGDGYYVYISIGSFPVQDITLQAYISEEASYEDLDFDINGDDTTTPSDLWMFMWIDYDPVMDYGEEQTIACYVLKGGQDITDQVSIWKIERDGGDTTSDAVWNNAHVMTDNEIVIKYSDLVSSVNKTKFTITATVDGQSTVSQITI